ncbi:MAG: hypothetical protein EOP45_09460, partial [Sphingobacteriaceae bacterium]
MRVYLILWYLFLFDFSSITLGQSLTVVPKADPIILQLDPAGRYLVQLSDIATITTKASSAPVVSFLPGSFYCKDIGKSVVNLKVTILPGTNATPSAVSLFYPTGVVFDSKGNLYIAEDGHDVRRISPDGQVSTFAGNDEIGYVDGPGTLARFNSVTGIAIDPADNLYVTDAGNNMVRKIDPLGIVSTVAGSLYPGFADGQGTLASFDSPVGITLDRLGNLYITDQNNNLIRKISPAGLVSTVAGNVSAGYADGQGKDARFNNPNGICADPSSNLYVADGNNFRIRKITPDGQVSTLAGNGIPVAVDGNLASAGFTNPSAIAMDASGNLFIGGEQLRKITPSGQVTTLAGNVRSGNLDGIGQAAGFSTIAGICFDADGVIYAADFANNKIRTVCPDNALVSTLAGQQVQGTQNGNVGTLQKCTLTKEITVPVVIADSLGSCTPAPLA